MYKIYIEDELIYYDKNPDNEYRLTEPVLNLRDNASGSLEFIMDSANRFYSHLDEAMLKDVTVYKNNSDVPYWSGFITEIKTDFFKRKHVECVGDLQLLSRCTMHDKVNEYSSITTSSDMSIIAQRYLQTILNTYNYMPDGTTRKVEQEHEILLGNVTVHMLSKAITQGTTVRIVPYVTSCEDTCFDALMKLQDSHGGHIRLRWHAGKRYLDWYADYPRQSAQVIRFGVNLLEFTKTADESKLFTVLYPVGDVLEDEVDITYTNVTGSLTASRKLNAAGAVVSAGSAYSVTSALAVTENTKYYYSGHMKSNEVIWSVYDKNGTALKVEYSGAETTGEVTVIERREVVFPDEASTIRFSFYKDDASEFSNYSKVEIAESADTLSEHVLITSVNNGSPYIETAAATTYGWIEKRMFFEGVNTPSGLLSRANRYLNTFIQTNLCIEVTALDLNLMGVSADEINMLDTVRIVSKPHNLDSYMPVTQLKIPLAEPDKQTFTLGISFKRKLSDLVGRKIR